MNINSVKNPEQFHHEIERRVVIGMEYLEAIISYCEDNGLEIESVIPIIKKCPILKAKLQNESEKLNLVKKEDNKLPL